ncbi:hypothetical protein CCACVL1_14070 [Corchorus capsularis]|uniref:Uncharacterized protein n=2 Tax=Corchorus capsularis TaxID=210143 RepID=A0A1R3I8F1_COCAP|nr:hypothetical protein CCACVL1_14070 [Corchorus capsularis]
MAIASKAMYKTEMQKTLEVAVL